MIRWTAPGRARVRNHRHTPGRKAITRAHTPPDDQDDQGRQPQTLVEATEREDLGDVAAPGARR